MTFKSTKLAMALAATSAALVIASPAAAQDCMPIGGVGIANFFAQGENQPLVISAAMSGTVQNAAGRILAQRETPTGLEMDLEHYFGRDDGGAFLTRDLAILTAVPGKPGRFMIEITYEIQEEVTRGTMSGVSGTFNSYGLVDLRDPNDLKGLVRYTGEICR